MTDATAMQKYTLIRPVCWQCDGEGFIAHCWEEWACLHPDDGCDQCRRKCDICGGKGGYP